MSRELRLNILGHIAKQLRCRACEDGVMRCTHCKLRTDEGELLGGLCKACRSTEKFECMECGKKKLRIAFGTGTQQYRLRQCMACDVCQECNAPRSDDNFFSNAHRTCKQCLGKLKKCIRCEQEKPRLEYFHAARKSQELLHCDSCKHHIQCGTKGCKTWFAPGAQGCLCVNGARPYLPTNQIISD